MSSGDEDKPAVNAEQHNPRPGKDYCTTAEAVFNTDMRVAPTGRRLVLLTSGGVAILGVLHRMSSTQGFSGWCEVPPKRSMEGAPFHMKMILWNPGNVPVIGRLTNDPKLDGDITGWSPLPIRNKTPDS